MNRARTALRPRSTAHLCPYLLSRRRETPSPGVGDGGHQPQPPATTGVGRLAEAWRCPILVVNLDAQAAVIERRDDRRVRSSVDHGVGCQFRNHDLCVARHGLRARDRGEPFCDGMSSEAWSRRRPPRMESHGCPCSRGDTVVTYPRVRPATHLRDSGYAPRSPPGGPRPWHRRGRAAPQPGLGPWWGHSDELRIRQVVGVLRSRAHPPPADMTSSLS